MAGARFVRGLPLTGGTISGSLNQSSGTAFFLGVSTNASDVYTVTPTVALTAYTTGAMYIIQINSSNTTTTPTINISGLGALTVVKRAATAMAASDMLANGYYLFVKQGTNLQCLNPAVP